MMLGLRFADANVDSNVTILMLGAQHRFGDEDSHATPDKAASTP
jgi:hypothetical protein